MRRGAKPANAKGESKRPVARKSPKTEGSRVRDLEKRLAEALEQQAATSEILRAISSSPTDVQPVFDTVVEHAARLCSARDAQIFRREGEHLRLVAHHGPIPTGPVGEFTMPISRGTINGRAVLEQRPVQVADLRAESAEFPEGQAIALEFGHRTVLIVPLMRDGVAVGTLAVRRAEVRTFTDAQVGLLQTFADQAVIAIENVRLFNETKEALEQQTATAEVLGVIASSPTDLQPVLNTVAERAARLCGANDATIFQVEDEALRPVARWGSVPTVMAFGMRYPMSRAMVSARAIIDSEIIHIEDVTTRFDEFPDSKGNMSQSGVKTVLAAPLFRESTPIGVILIRRLEVRPFSNKQIALLKTFADQAVIAIENVRLFKELEARNADLGEALEQQTATSEILRVISRSPTDVQPVFDAIVKGAVRLCEAAFATVNRFDGSLTTLGAQYNLSPEELEVVQTRVFPFRPTRDTVSGRALLDRATVHIHDIGKDHEYTPVVRALERYRTGLSVPMLRGGVPIGTITLWRSEVRPFSDKQIAMVETFADQAVIAIENVRLFTELQARTADLTRSVEQLTALGEVGRAVSSTLDLEMVLTTIVLRAVQISGLDGGVVFEYDEGAEEFVQRAATETGGALAEARRTTRIRKGEGALGRTAITLEPVQVPDITVPGAHASRLRDILIESGVRAVLAVPMVREGRLIGSVGVTRNRPGEFPAETIELLRIFATQSALAIQNARLFHEIADKSRQLEAASRHKSEFLANMSHELRTPLNAVIGFSEVLLQRMFGELNAKQDEYLQDIYASGQHLLSLINDILDLSKIEAGRMELEMTDFDFPTALDNTLTLIRERAGRRGIALHLSVDERLGQMRADERKIRQIVLNLLSNAIKFTPEGGRIEVAAVPRDEFVEVSVSDTGIGIAPEDQEAVFEEFRQVGTAAKKVEGTGLGLALSRKFIELHGGRIWVQSQLGIGSTFTFSIPLRRRE
jgi:signal transduction histidine kinase